MEHMRRKAIQYTITSLAQRLIGLLCFTLAAGAFADWRGRIYFGIYIIISIAALFVMLRNRPETLAARGGKYENTKNWDKVLLRMYVLLAFYGAHIVAGLDIRFGWSSVQLPVIWAGLILNLIASVLSVWPVYENSHFESTARIQSDRNQSVCDTGPYRFIRHPGYAFIILWAISLAMIFGVYTGLVSLVVIVVIVARTYLEDAMLQNELPAYPDYTKKVKYRLLPFVW